MRRRFGAGQAVGRAARCSGDRADVQLVFQKGNRPRPSGRGRAASLWLFADVFVR